MARTTIRTEDITGSAVTAAKIASGAVDTSGLEDDIALLGFRVASNGSLAKYNLVDQTVDDFQDTSGVDASASTNENRDASGKYYSGAIAGSPTYTVFNSTPGGGTWTVPAGVTSVEALVVAGGGAGGWMYGGGGGAGGIVHHTSFATTPAASVTVTVGAGGAAQNSNATPVAGGDSVFSTITAKGGGGGGNSGNGAADGGSGGGGGAAGSDVAGGSADQPAVSGATVYATAGGNGLTDHPYTGGGGGGASAAGAAASGGTAGAGGAGQQFANFTSYGASSGYFGGGGGGTYNVAYGSSVGAGGIGGGGSGREMAQGTAYSGTDNTGGGGGAGGNSSSTYSGAGGSGFVGLLYTPQSYDDMTLVSTTTAAQAAPTKGDIVLTYTNGAGTTTLDTDLTAEISADGGSTWTSLPLASEGSTGSHNIATSHDVTISSTITAPYNMAYRIKTLNQSASKTTRIQAVSLGWS